MNLDFSIDVNFDEEVKVFVGTSEDIPGLTIEASSIHEFLETAMDIVPYLLAINLKITDRKDGDVNVYIGLKEPRRTEPKLKQVKPIYRIHEEPNPIYAMA